MSDFQPNEFDSHVIAQAIHGIPVNGHADLVSDRVKLLVRKLEDTEPKDRPKILEGFGTALDPASNQSFITSIAGADPHGPCPEPKPAEDDGFDFGLMTAGDLDRAEFPRTFLIDGVLVEGQPCVVGGPRKALKTSVMVALGLALASGRDFMGQFRVPSRRRVLFLSGESGQATTQETVRRVARSMDVDLDELADQFQVGFSLPSLGKAEHMEALGRAIRRNRADVVIIDPLYLCLLSAGVDVNASNLFEMGPLLAAVSKVCLDAGATPILVHHLRKNRDNPDAPPELEDLAFAGVQEFARQWLLLGRRRPYEPGTGHHELWFSYGGSAGHSGAWAFDVNEGVADEAFCGRYWSTTLTSAGEARKAAKEEKAADREERKKTSKANTTNQHAVNVADLLRKRGPMSKSDIRDNLNLSGSVVGVALAYAENHGWIRWGEKIAKARTGGGYRDVDGYEYTDQSILLSPNPDNPDSNPDNPDKSDCPGKALTGTGHPPSVGGGVRVRVTRTPEESELDPEAKLSGLAREGVGDVAP